MRALLLVGLVGCGFHMVAAESTPDADSSPDAASDCTAITDQQPATVTAGDAGEYVLAMTASAASPTSWGEEGNEAVVLEVRGAHGLIGHLILHEGMSPFPYAMHVGKLAAGDALTIQVSTLTAPNAVRGATVCAAALSPATSEGIANAPIYRWPVQKVFNDVPLVVGWSAAKKTYQTVMTNEDGGTAEQCGGGASGMQAEIARWGRSTDIESHYGYGGAAPSWERCTGRVDTGAISLRTEDAHPILYYGDGHNRVFENRGGYGSTCGTGAPEKPDGDLAGWNTQNTSSALADDEGKVVILRPVPVDLDALGYAQFGGRREALVDQDAPWIYRIASLELAREGKIDDAKTLPMSRYLYVDVRVADVGGSGDSYCTLTVSGGFKLRAVTTGGTVISSGQMTADFTGTGHDWKRVAIALPAGVTAADIDHFIVDAYDNDGIYVTAIGDAFIPTDTGLDYVRRGTKDLALYVDDGNSGCSNGTTSAGPGGTAYDCVGGQVTIAR